MGRKPLGPGKSKGSQDLFRWIQDKGLTFTRAGELLGYPKESISRYVTGARKPDPSAMYKMEKLAGIKMSRWLE